MKRVTALLLTAVLLMSVLLTACGDTSADTEETTAQKSAEKTSSDAEYATGLFDTSYVHKINVEISDDDWKDLTENPLDKTKYSVNVTIDGETVENVSFATKGNTSLSQVADSDSDRYSFKINFGKYEKGQTYQGLDKLNLNNIMSDATYMKDYLSYLIMRKAGVNAPLTSYAELSINGKVHGLYIAIEDVADAFLERNFGNDDGALYKPETEQLDNMDKAGNPGGKQNDTDNTKNDIRQSLPDDMQLPTDENGNIQMPGGGEPPQGMPQQGGAAPGDMQSPTDENGNIQMPGGGEPPQGMPQQGGAAPGDMQLPTDENGNIQRPDGADNGNMSSMPGGPGGGQANGADLKHSDDNADSYSDIFDNAENDVTDDDKTELIAAIKALNSGEDIDEYWDMDQIIRYFVAHNFVLNYDSYTGTMLHNYYLYEDGGKVTVFPWDYNLAFGGFMGGSDATSAVNTPIDSPLNGTDEDSRPLWKAIASNEEYLALYHKYYGELLESFFESGDCTAEIERVSEMIRPYVEADPSAFYTVDEFDTAVDTLKKFCSLRAESIKKQIDGSLGSTSDAQNKDDMVDASGLTISAMGLQGGGKQPDNGQQPGTPGGMTPPNDRQPSAGSDTAAPTETAGG